LLKIPYSNVGFTTKATFAGIVQGVVVQTRKFAPLNTFCYRV
jgi:hypothetical protein